MAWSKTDRINIKGKRENLCWTCQNATGGCSWSCCFEPVKGWNAEPDFVGTKKDVETFKIYDCPLYIQEKPKIKEKR